MSGAKLRLGPLPKDEPVKFSVTLSGDLKASLDRYAALHAQTYGESVDAAELVPHMLAAFMARDRVFRRLITQGASTRKGQVVFGTASSVPGK